MKDMLLLWREVLMPLNVLPKRQKKMHFGLRVLLS